MEQQQRPDRFNRRRVDRNLTVSHFTTFVNLFTLNVVNRYPDVTTLEAIPVDDIQRIAEFTVSCIPILLDTWDRACEANVRQAA